MTNFFRGASQLLRGQGWATEGPHSARTLAALLAYLTLGGLAYGGVMGGFGLGSPDRLWQVAYSALKVPLLLLVTFALGLPSFFVLNTLFGLRDDFGQALRALAATQAGVALALASLAPLTAVWYLTTADYEEALLFNALMFAVASLAGQLLLRRFYQPLIARDSKHRWLLRGWLVVYAFVGIQMGWLLRPFVGMPDAPVQFFRADTWGNAYLIVGDKLWRLVTP
jgi:hypothetical protein